MTFAERLVALWRLLHTYFCVSRSMSLDCCREFDLSLGGLCSEVLQYIHQDIIKTKDLQEHFFSNFLPSLQNGEVLSY